MSFMRRAFFLVVAGVVLVAQAWAGVPSERPIRLDVHEYKLDNGLKVLLLEDHSIPAFTFWTFYRVGSINERPGITGISHLFEHMMFRGAKKYGPGAFDKTMESFGGGNNAFTDRDVTAYYDVMPATGFPLICDLESDRMASLNIVKETLDPEREVVKEERRFRTENDVDGQLDEVLMASAYVAHPYRGPVLGWMADLDNITVEDCRDYFRTYYAPNNATMIVVGDFDEAKALELIRRSFGSIPAQPPPRPVVNAEPPQKGEKRVTYHKEAQVPAVRIAYHVPAAGEEDFYAMELLQVILADGRSSRLYRRLVRDEQAAISVTGSNEWRHQPGLFTFGIDLRPEKDSEAALSLFSKEIEQVRAEGVSEQELLKAKNRTRAGFLRGLKTNTGRGAVLGNMEVIFGDWRRYTDYLDGIEKVTTVRAREAAKKWLAPTNRTVVTLVPEEIASPGEAGQSDAAVEAAALGAERRIP